MSKSNVTLENILEAAGELLMNSPYHKVTMDKVREKVGVGKGTLYRHFDSKEDLYCKVVLNELDRLVESLQENFPPDIDDPATKLRILSERMVGFFEQKRSLFALLRSEEIRGSQAKKRLFQKWKERRNDVVKVFENVIREGIDEGAYSPEIPPDLAAHFFLAMLKSGSRSAGRNKADHNGAFIVSKALFMFENGMKQDD